MELSGGIEGEEDQSGGGWIASGTTSRRGLSEKEVQERVQWRCLVRHIDPT